MTERAITPLRQRMIDDMAIWRLAPGAGDASFLREHGRQVRPPFWAITRSAGVRGGARLSAPSGAIRASCRQRQSGSYGAQASRPITIIQPRRVWP